MGHTRANEWPLCRVWSEVEIVRRKQNEAIASQATVDHTVHAAIHGGKDGHSALKKMLKKLGG